MARVHHDVLSVEWIKLELIRTAYATRGGLFAAMDPRAVVVWYIVLAIVPWFTHNITVLAGLFAIGVVSIFLARVGPLILGLFVLGMGMEVVYMSIAAWLFGGNIDTVIALAALNLKLGVVAPRAWRRSSRSTPRSSRMRCSRSAHRTCSRSE
ncbi:hypothetical protein [Microbacterium sp.]|uniref:hypothetical protein n=1 Tax=Microbacterium sp. TaxID=51671 RepID=UPI00257F58BB|nr:hypothetical protein [Microbacterium sp.]